MLPHEGDDLHQVSSAEKGEAGECDSNRARQQLAFRGCLNAQEQAILNLLEKPSNEDPFTVMCERVAHAIAFWDVYTMLGQPVRLYALSRALDDVIRDEILYWHASDFLGASCEEMNDARDWVRDGIIKCYSEIVGAMLPHVMRLDKQAEIPLQWNDRLASLLHAIANPSSSLGGK